MAKRKGGLRRRSGRKQQGPHPSLSTSPSPLEGSDSGSSDLDYAEAESFAHQTLAPSFFGVVSSYLAWARLIYLFLSLQDIADWISSMVLGLGSLWGHEARQSVHNEMELVDQPESKKKVRRRRRQDAPVGGEGSMFELGCARR